MKGDCGPCGRKGDCGSKGCPGRDGCQGPRGCSGRDGKNARELKSIKVDSDTKLDEDIRTVVVVDDKKYDHGHECRDRVKIFLPCFDIKCTRNCHDEKKCTGKIVTVFNDSCDRVLVKPSGGFKIAGCDDFVRVPPNKCVNFQNVKETWYVCD
uniref:Collagen triple helix repeat protein n=1 Tax=Pithovirus LCPAC104 TaxID=2506589 RepID=A0A481Z6C3_9VIRU|nr:MAG: collagen triple helix repeat protein [Pithovirus LCPAC104]